MTQEKPKIVVITGPTASGKTSLAIELARWFKGEIINADSMQVYRYMDIGTAKPSRDERASVPHFLIDVADPDDEFNAALYCQLAQQAIELIRKKNRIVFLVGGTGLYIKTLLGGLLKGPPSNQEIREALNRRWREEGGAGLYERLKRKDPEAALRIHPHDRVRIIRSLEIIELTKKRFSDLAREHRFGEKNIFSLKLALHIEREELYHKINVRTLEMIEKGLVNETENLLNRGYSAELKPMKSLGYRHAVSYLYREWDIDKMSYLLQRDTRHYAKRQLTWFRADPEIEWINPNQIALIKRKISLFLDKS